MTKGAKCECGHVKMPRGFGAGHDSAGCRSCACKKTPATFREEAARAVAPRARKGGAR